MHLIIYARRIIRTHIKPENSHEQPPRPMNSSCQYIYKFRYISFLLYILALSFDKNF